MDDDVQKTGTTVGEFSMLSSRVMFVGGRPRTTHVAHRSPADANHNFKGCLKQVGLSNFYPRRSRSSERSCMRPHYDVVATS